jgi:parvulin-like peptidyl-prolyl isomerase
MNSNAVMQQPKTGSRTMILCSFKRLVGASLIGSAAIAVAVAQTPPPPSRPAAPKVSAPPAARPSPAPVPQAAAPKPAVPRDDVVARVGGSDVTAADVRAFVATLGAREQIAVTRDPALLSQAIRVMLANQLALKEASEKKWDQQPAVAVQLQQLKEKAIVESYLQSVSMPPAGFPADADIEKAYEANKSSFLVPRQFQLAQVFVALAKDADKAAEDAARKKLADVQAKLKVPSADFAAIAAANSDDKDASERGGEIGLVSEPQLRPEIKAQVLGLAKNAWTDAIKLDDGWHIVKLIDTKAAYTRALTEVHDLIAAQLRMQRAEANRRAYLAKILEQNAPAVNEIALSKIFEGSDQAAGR